MRLARAVVLRPLNRLTHSEGVAVVGDWALRIPGVRPYSLLQLGAVASVAVAFWFITNGFMILVLAIVGGLTHPPKQVVLAALWTSSGWCVSLLGRVSLM